MKCVRPAPRVQSPAIMFIKKRDKNGKTYRSFKTTPYVLEMFSSFFNKNNFLKERTKHRIQILRRLRYPS